MTDRRPRDTAASSAKMRIELVLPYLVRGGMETMVARLARALAARGHRVGVTCTQFGGPLADELRDDGHRVVEIPTLGVLTNAYAPRLERWLRETRPDVVHVHNGTWLKTARAARRAGVRRIVHTIHGLQDGRRWWDGVLERMAVRYTDHVVAVSDALRHAAASQLAHPVERIGVISNGIDTDRFRPGSRTGALRTRADLPPDAIVIGNVARMQDVKNHELLFEAFARLAVRLPNAHLVVVGEGPLRDKLTAQAERLGMQHRIHLIGSAADTAPLYREFDLFVLPSRSEGTSMSLLEAMASGVSVVATAVGGTPDLLAGGARGRLVPSEAPAALAEAMWESLTDPSRHEAAEATRREIEQHYSESAMVSAYERLYGLVAPAPAVQSLSAEVVTCAE